MTRPRGDLSKMDSNQNEWKREWAFSLDGVFAILIKPRMGAGGMNYRDTILLLALHKIENSNFRIYPL